MPSLMPSPMRVTKLPAAGMRSPSTCWLGLGEGLAILDLLFAILLEADGLDGNEARSIHRREPFEGVHGSILLGVQVGSIAGSAENIGVTLVSGQPDDTSNIVLAEDDRVLNLVIR